jgi:hypothetical protein
MMDTRKYESRISQSYQKIKEAYEHRNKGVLPFLISDVNYFLSGETPELIPDNYFTDSKSMMQYQINKIKCHMERFEDDYVPFLFPWYGTGVLASGFGSEVVVEKKMDPAVKGTLIKTIGDISRLSIPDPQKDGLMPKVLETIRYFRKYSDLPISFTDPQGPLTTALTMVGPTNFFVWLYEYPSQVHQLMELCTEAFIRWMKTQKQEIGTERGRVCFPHGIVLPEEFGTVWLSDDDCIAISPEHYREFVIPYNSKIFKEFGGGTLHFCGSAEHQIENFLQIDGLTGVNNFCMGNFRQIYNMQKLFENRLALKVCDFTPLSIRKYYKELIGNLKKRGTILASFVLPELALNDEGRYEMVSRKGDAMAREVYGVFRELFSPI